MVRAVLKNGVIYPLDPLPEAWREGQEVQVEEAALEPTSSEELESLVCRAGHSLRLWRNEG